MSPFQMCMHAYTQSREKKGVAEVAMGVEKLEPAAAAVACMHCGGDCPPLRLRIAGWSLGDSAGRHCGYSIVLMSKVHLLVCPCVVSRGAFHGCAVRVPCQGYTVFINRSPCSEAYYAETATTTTTTAAMSRAREKKEVGYGVGEACGG